MTTSHSTVSFSRGGIQASCSATAALLNHTLPFTSRAVSQALFDWELAGEDHRDRLERIFGTEMPQILYARCERPLAYEVDRLVRIVRDQRVAYALFDSVAFACDGPPEAAEVAGRYFRAVRQIGVGSLHIAHITKADGGDQKPFGSVFWHNGARCTWFVKLAEDSADSDNLSLGFFNRKANLGRLQAPVGFTVVFGEDCTTFKRGDLANHPDLAERLTLKQRMQHLLRSGALTVTEIAEDLGVHVNTVTQTVTRHAKKGHVFIVLDGEKTSRRIGLRSS
jgi:hypothetical protein